MKEITLTDGSITIVNDEYYELVKNDGSWTNVGGRAARFWHGELLYLHHLILPHISGKVVDHINGNTLDNRKENLRYLAHWENIHNRDKQKNNTSGFIGVRWCHSSKGYQSSIQIRGKRIHFGTFKTAEEAARVRDSYVRANLMGIAKLNFP